MDYVRGGENHEIYKALEFVSVVGNLQFNTFMDYFRDGEIQGRSLVFLEVHCPCILPSLI